MQSRLSWCRLSLSAVFFLVLAVLPVIGYPTDAEVAPAEAEPPAVPPTLVSPRATMGTFLGAMNDIKRGDPARIDAALTTLDLSEISSLVRRERGTDLAWMLLEVMDRTRLVDLERVPERESGRPWVFARYEAGAITIARGEDEAWRFDEATIERLPQIHEETAGRRRVVGGAEDAVHLPFHLRLREHLPDALKQRAFLLENWRWLGLLLIATAGVAVDFVVSLVVRQLDNLG